MIVSARAISPIERPKLHLEVLSEDDVRHIHQASLEVIETVGVCFPSTWALDILEEAGAMVDRESQIARLPGQTVEEALAKAPPPYVLCARDPDLDLPLDGEHSYLSTDGCGVEVIDLETGERRRSTKRDVAESALVADYLPQITFYWPLVAAQDCPPETHSLHELEAAWNNTTKHVQTECVITAREAQAAIEMAAAIVGGRQELRKRPILSIMQCTISPLGQDGGSLEAALVAAQAGLPVGFMTMASCCSTGPATLAGNLVVGNAEVIAASALIELAYPGTAIFYAAAQTAMDLRTGAYTGGGPEDYLFGAATNQLADFYRIPLSMGAFATGAKEPDWQAALDNAFAGLMPVLSGADMLTGAGLLYGSRILSYEQLLMDCEIYEVIQAAVQGIEVNEETLALDAIKAVGVRGHYLDQKHTLKHLKERWMPSLVDHRPYSAWEKDGRRGARERAHEKARWILSNHRPEPLEPKLQEELIKIIAALEKR
ncbi:MAG: trimethylamine methyltransferase family protein [Anaerolineae bacterium]